MSERFCTGCRHMVGPLVLRCMRDLTKAKRHPVNGAIVVPFPECEEERRSRWLFRSRYCGPEGHFWEPK